MNKSNYTLFFFFFGQSSKRTFLVCCRILVISLGVPGDEKGWRSLVCGTYSEQPRCQRHVDKRKASEHWFSMWGDSAVQGSELFTGGPEGTTGTERRETRDAAKHLTTHRTVPQPQQSTSQTKMSKTLKLGNSFMSAMQMSNYSILRT